MPKLSINQDKTVENIEKTVKNGQNIQKPVKMTKNR